MLSERLILSVDDLSTADVDSLLARARENSPGFRRHTTPFVVGLLFTTPSLRTRTGYAVATARLGGTAVDVHELRWGPGMSQAESFADTLRTLSGMVDVVVARTPDRLDRALVTRSVKCAFVNAGDGDGEHPTQALVDLLAITVEAGDVADQRIGISGDLGSRCVRSLLRLLDRRPPKELVLLAPQGRDDDHGAISPRLARRVSRRDAGQLDDLDVLYLPGLPEGVGADRLTAPERLRFALTAETARRLPPHAAVLSPLPVVDEIADEVRDDPRVRVFEQSDLAVRVRTALLAALLDERASELVP